MPPIRKVQLDKAAWLWAETENDPSNISDDHLDLAYRGNVPKCKIGTCRRNCRGNPYCLSGLGESKWLSESIDEGDDEDPDLQIRPPNTFVGLKNLGATCYVNSLVQLLFHNLAFRRAIFRWNPDEITDLRDENGSLKPPHTVVEQLQFLFGMMQFGTRKSIDPLDFIKSLDLEPSLQQDAQEFSKLLFSLLEDALQQQANPLVKNLISSYFRGEYSYTTRCSKCQNDSISPSTFYELDLNVKGHKTLHESITEFLKEEKLEGCNMYFCSCCNEKQEATRFINLRKLPPVLNLQLMRFIYDRQKGHKKKITSSLQFPDTLDMSQYLASDTPDEIRQPILYNLTAVLIHKGPSANSGHYVAHICDQTTGTWYKFNDEVVEKVEGKQLKLGSEDDDEDGAKKAKQPRLAKGYLESSNAYMLVYTAKSIQEVTQPISEIEVRPQLLENIRNSNESFENIMKETNEEKEIKKITILAYKEEMKSLLEFMAVNSEGYRDWEAISLKWLTQWLQNSKGDFRPIDNQPLLCPHSKLHPDMFSSTKYISKEAADVLFAKYGGGPRLPASKAICHDCVSNKCRGIKFRTKLLEDAKEITALLKVKDETSNEFWVGKNSLKNWRKKALALFEEKEGNFMPIRDVEECPPSPGSDNEAALAEVATQTARSLSESEFTSASPTPDSSGDSPLHSRKPDLSPNSNTFDFETGFGAMLNTLENDFKKALTDIRFKLGHSAKGLASEFYEKWLEMDTLVKGFFDFNERCISPVSVPTAVVSSTTNGQSLCVGMIELNGYNHSNEQDSKSKKRKHESIDKDKDGSDDCKNGSKSDDEEDVDIFNEDVVCLHGNFTPDEGRKRLVSEAVWKKFRYYFPNCPDFPKDSEVCPVCLNLANQDQASLDMKREQITKMKEKFASLLNGRGRPPFRMGTYRIVNVPEFLRPWRRFIRENGRSPAPFCLRNSNFLCFHELLAYNPASPEDSSIFCPVTDEEWEDLQSFFQVDREITVTYGDLEGEVFETSPSICEECLNARLASMQEALLQYDKAKIYIRRISSDKKLSKKKDCDIPTEVPGQAMKRLAVSGGVASPTASACTDQQQQCTSESIRRSTRHRRAPGEKELVLSSSDTLRDLKLKILSSLGVAPFDQHLYTEDGTELTDPTATLSSLNIYPNSILNLLVDEPVSDSPIMIGDYTRISEPEAGFKGTVLLKR